MRSQYEVSAARLARQAEVKLRQFEIWRHLLDVLYLVDIIIWKVFLKWAADVFRLLLTLVLLGIASTTSLFILFTIARAILLIALSGN